MIKSCAPLEIYKNYSVNAYDWLCENIDDARDCQSISDSVKCSDRLRRNLNYYNSARRVQFLDDFSESLLFPDDVATFDRPVRIDPEASISGDNEDLFLKMVRHELQESKSEVLRSVGEYVSRQTCPLILPQAPFSIVMFGYYDEKFNEFDNEIKNLVSSSDRKFEIYDSVTNNIRSTVYLPTDGKFVPLINPATGSPHELHDQLRYLSSNFEVMTWGKMFPTWSPHVMRLLVVTH